MPRELIRAFGILKKAAALVNRDLGQASAGQADSSSARPTKSSPASWTTNFPLQIWQTGSRHADQHERQRGHRQPRHRARRRRDGSKKPVHPNDHVNMSQSSNDTFPTAMHIAAASECIVGSFPPSRRFVRAIDAKAKEFEDIVKIGRTHLQDATPLTLGQEISGWVSQLDARHRAHRTHPADGLFELAIGGTAVGTGLNTHPEFAERAAKKIAELTGLPFASHPNKFAALSAHDELVFASGALETSPSR